eukprot:8818092-Lingulodinium_polyedra.AAC.1
MARILRPSSRPGGISWLRPFRSLVLLTHGPKNPHCISCQRGKHDATPRRAGPFGIEAARWGEHLTTVYSVSTGDLMR